MPHYTSKQWKIIVLYSTASVCHAICLSVQTPFYPQEAEKKGLHPSEYGMVFSIYFLVMLVTNLAFGKVLPTIGARLLSILGILTTSITSLLFGSLHLIYEPKTFIALSFIIRSVEAAGTSAFIIALDSSIMLEFSSELGFSFGIVEAAFGAGFMLGPAIGVALYKIGGFAAPFLGTGVILLSVMLVIIIFLPQIEDNCILPPSTIGTLTLLRIPSIQIGLYVVCIAFFDIDFIFSVLEPHLRRLNPTHSQTGLAFTIGALSHTISAFICGIICDKSSKPHYVWIFGATVICIAMIFLGPAPYLPLHLSLPLSFIFLMIHGIGTGAQVVSSFTAINKYTLAAGYSEDIYTYAIISTLYNSYTYLGSFLGPLTAGFLYQYIGFPWGVHVIIVLYILLILITIINNFE